MFIARNS